jgi:hypothetical protein
MTDELEATLDGVRWLSPDAELDRLDREAELLFARCADELTACFERHARGELNPLEVFVTRSAREATVRWTRQHSAATRELRPSRSPHVGWLGAMDAVMSHRMRIEPKGPSMLDALASFRARMTDASVPLPPAWRPAWNLVLPGFFALYRHVHVGRVMEREGLGSSPWGPLVQLWSLGCWPLLSAQGELIVWVPARRDGIIVADADVESEKPLRIESRMLYGGEHLPPGRLGLVLTVRENSMWVQPLFANNVISAGTGEIISGSDDEAALGSIVYERVVTAREPEAIGLGRAESSTAIAQRYIVQVRAVGKVSYNGEALKSFVLAPGGIVDVQTKTGRTQLYYLGANDARGDSAMPTVHDDVSSATDVASGRSDRPG